MTDIAPPFSEDLVSSDLIDNNLPPEEPPLVPPAYADSDDNVWMTPAGKEFRSSFLFQSSCYLPDDDATESETSCSHTVQMSPLQRHERYPQHQSIQSKTSSSEGLDSITSILRRADSGLRIDHLQRRVVFSDDLNSLSDEVPDDDDIPKTSETYIADEGNSTISSLGFRISVPLHQTYGSLPPMPSTPRQTTNDSFYYTSQWKDDDGTTLVGAQSRTGVSALTDNESHHKVHGKFLSLLFPKARQKQLICLVMIVFMVLSLTTVAITCGTLQCRQPKSVSLPSSFAPNVLLLSPSSSPYVQPSTTAGVLTSARPTVAPKVVIYSTAQLYNAVDTYMSKRYNTTTTSHIDKTPIGQWDVSLVSNFSSVFDADRNPTVVEFNDDLSNWDTSNALTMERMFCGAEKFDGNISTWNTSNVVNMKELFSLAFSFNGNISFWDVSKVISMEGMCKYTIAQLLRSERIKETADIAPHFIS
jgi:surface protein